MAWIELHQGLFRHVKTAAAADALRKPRYLIVGHLAALWCWALDAKPDGGPLSARDVKLGADWGGNADVFAQALLDAGFLDGDFDGFWLHDWNDYAGRLLNQRRVNAERMRTARATHVQRTTAARAPATVPNPTVPNRTKEKEGERSRAKPTQKRVTVVDDEFKARMVAKYADRASPELVNEIIEESFGHESASKWPDQQSRVQRWLRRTDWEREKRERTTGGGATSRESGTYANAARPGAVARNGYSTGYRARPNLTPPGEFGDTWDARPRVDVGAVRADLAGASGGAAEGVGGPGDPGAARG